MSVITVVGVKQERAKHTALGDSTVQHQSRKDVTASLNCLGSVCEEITY